MDAIMNAVGAKSELELLHMSAWTMLACGVAAFVGLQFMAAPYGRFADSAGKMFGFFMNGKVAWLLQEAPAFLLPAFFWFNEARDSTSDSAVRRLSPNTVLLSMFLLHYVHRAFIFPFRINGGKPTPFGIFLMAFVFCVWNGYMQGRYLTHFQRFEETTWLEPHFVLGVATFFVGMAINLHADTILLNLRKGDTTPGQYHIPRGGMFHFVSGANFFGEIVEWTGFAIAAWSLPAAAFAVFAFCNIGPRGAQHHAWYKKKFEDYPVRRKAVIPFIW